MSREEVAHVRRVRGDVVLRAGIEVGPRCAPRAARRPGTAAADPTSAGCICSGVNFAGEHVPAPLVDHQAERQERDLLQRDLHLLVDRALSSCATFASSPMSAGIRASSTAGSCRRSPRGSRRSRPAERGSAACSSAGSRSRGRARGGSSTESSSVGLMHILMRRSLSYVTSHALAWHTTSRSLGLGEQRALPERRGQRHRSRAT